MHRLTMGNILTFFRCIKLAIRFNSLEQLSPWMRAFSLFIQSNFICDAPRMESRQSDTPRSWSQFIGFLEHRDCIYQYVHVLLMVRQLIVGSYRKTSAVRSCSVTHGFGARHIAPKKTAKYYYYRYVQCCLRFVRNHSHQRPRLVLNPGPPPAGRRQPRDNRR